MSTLYEREKLKRGDIIRCYGDERIFLAYINGAFDPYICVCFDDEDSFKEGKKFSVFHWKEKEVSAKPKEWYEQIPEKGVVCWVSDYDGKARQYARLIVAVSKNNNSKFVSDNRITWKYATPVKPEECYKGGR